MESCGLGNSRNFNVIFQVTPPFTFDNSRQPIVLECRTVPVGTIAVVVGCGATSVRQLLLLLITI